jgi:arylsulfatase A-like enzyme
VKEKPPPKHYVVTIVIDAMRPMYFSHVSLPHIDALMRTGVVYDRAFVGEMESSTPGVHVTIGTGTLPRENGFLGFGWATPDTRKYVDFRTLLANGQIDPVLKALPIPSIAARLHQFQPHAVSVAVSGHKDYAAVGLGGGTADYVLYGKYTPKNYFIPAFLHGPPPLTPAEQAGLTVKLPLPLGAEDAWAFQYAATMARHVRPRLLMMNLPETDTWGHWYGPDDRKVFVQLMQNIDRGVGLIEKTYRDLGILNQTDFIITGDHGMMESRSAYNWKNVQNTIRSSGAQIARADGSGGAIWLMNPADAKAAAEKLAASHPAHVEAILYRSAPGNDYKYELASPVSWLVGPRVATALEHLVDSTAGIHGPDLWVLYRENYTVDVNNTSGKWKGTHGGATWKVQHIPLIISGPGIRKGVHSAFPARSIDVAPTVERLLGLPYIKRDGVILADALSSSLPGEAGPQRAVTASLGADAAALEAQSQADSRAGKWPHHPPIYRCSVDPKKTCTNTANTATNQ